MCDRQWGGLGVAGLWTICSQPWRWNLITLQRNSLGRWESHLIWKLWHQQESQGWGDPFPVGPVAPPEGAVHGCVPLPPPTKPLHGPPPPPPKIKLHHMCSKLEHLWCRFVLTIRPCCIPLLQQSFIYFTLWTHQKDLWWSKHAQTRISALIGSVLWHWPCLHAGA